MKITQTEVSELYVSIFNRAGEGEGNQFWQNSGMSISEMATEMLDTQDAKIYFGDSINDDQAFIEHIYQNTLNKTYSDDKEGIDFWTSMLETNSRGDVISSLIEAINDTQYAGTKAQEQFNNRVKIADYTADNVFKAPQDYKTELGFEANLFVSDDMNTVEEAYGFMDTMSVTYGYDSYMNANEDGFNNANNEYDYMDYEDEMSVGFGSGMSSSASDGMSGGFMSIEYNNPESNDIFIA